MHFHQPLIAARLQRRYKRFLADVVLETGEAVTAHCPNPGAMTGLDDAGARVWLSHSASPRRKLAHTLELVEVGDTIVGIHTGRPNAIVEESIAAGLIPELAGYRELRREVRYGAGSRIDFVLDDPMRGRVYVEVKNVHLVRTPGLHEFPDCVTKRGAKHLDELAEMAALGHRAVVVFLIQRADGDRFRLARDLDAAFGAAFDRATAAGVETIAYRCAVSTERIVIEQRVAIDET